MQQHCSKYFARRPHTHTHTMGMGSIGLKSTFSEHGHVTYKIKGNHEMQQHGCKYFTCRPHLPPTHTHTHIPSPLSLGFGSKDQKVKIPLFQNMVMLQRQQHCRNMVEIVQISLFLF